MTVTAWFSALGFGTLLGVGLKYVLDYFSEKRQRRQERNALLRLISIEMHHNAATHMYARKHAPQLMLSDEIDALKMDTWEAARNRLAQFVGAEGTQEDFDFLATHYQRLQSLIAFGRSPMRRGQRADVNVAAQLDRSVRDKLLHLEKSWHSADKVIGNYIVPIDTTRVGPGK